MDDTTDKHCNFKTTDCTVTSTKDLYEALNFPKRFECPCKYTMPRTSIWPIYGVYCHRLRRILRLRNPTREEKLHLQDNELRLWIFYSITTLSSLEVFSFFIAAIVLLIHLLIFRFYPLNQQFSSHLAQTGMYRNYSLNTSFDKPFCNQQY